jgi:recombinational DNA repair protein RecR
MRLVIKEPYPSLRSSKRKRTTDSSRGERIAIKLMTQVSASKSICSVCSDLLKEDERTIANKLAREEKVISFI